MSIFYDPEYKRLALDSSNEMMDYDGDRGLGRYEPAARHVRAAGAGRERMARLAFDAGEYRWAASGWLSAAACFDRLPDLGRMRACLGRAQELERRGKIPPEYPRLFGALRERERELIDLERRLAAFDAEYARLDGSGDDRATLDWLLEQVRELPGLPALHHRIARHAERLGDHDLARRHLDWADVFEADPPGDPPHPGANGHPGVVAPAGEPAPAP
ncbi:MAG: hypothetical protein K2X87_08115 [Gemmataceae bacterium]|nr:hypothetical protein [Gemmataceae bacterium]